MALLKEILEKFKSENCFLRAVGDYNQENIKNIRIENCFSKVIENLPHLNDNLQTQFYSQSFEKWKNDGVLENDTLKNLGECFQAAIEQLENFNPNLNDCMQKNFAVNSLYRLDNILKDWDGRQPIKIIFEDIQKPNDYFFCFLMYKLGAGVLLLQQQDIPLTLQKLGLSDKIALKKSADEKKADTSHDSDKSENTDRIMFKLPPRPPKSNHKNKLIGVNKTSLANIDSTGNRIINSVEQLEQLAKSVAVITMHNRDGTINGTASGIMIGEKGYLLTNSHILNKAYYFSVRIEQDEQIYQTDEVIKYDNIIDMAVIRINRRLDPIELYTGGLASGQKVISIGSPKKNVNTISKGILSDFRTVNDIEMFHYTAEVAQGSSGNAVLDMQGRLIGMYSMTIHAESNINLAISNSHIFPFVKGFI